MSLINSTASSGLWFCPIKGLDPTRPPIVLLCFGSLVQVYISSQCLTPSVYDSTKEPALGISQGEVVAVCIVTEKDSRGGQQSNMWKGKQEKRWSLLALYLNPKLDSPTNQKWKYFQCLDICRNCQMEIEVWEESTTTSTICTAVVGNGSKPSRHKYWPCALLDSVWGCPWT